MVEIVAIIASTGVIIVILTYLKDSLDRRLKAKTKAAGQESVQMQADIGELQVECRELRKKVAELQEQIAELYIQQHDKR